MDPEQARLGAGGCVGTRTVSPKSETKEKKKNEVLMLQMIISPRQVQRTQKQETCFSQKRAVVEQSDARYEDAVAHRDEALQRQAWGAENVFF